MRDGFGSLNLPVVSQEKIRLRRSGTFREYNLADKKGSSEGKCYYIFTTQNLSLKSQNPHLLT
jgi:hypothetical protein